MSYVSLMSYQNPWWSDRYKIYEEPHVKTMLSSKPRFMLPPQEGSLLVLGPRQVGKTIFFMNTIMSLLSRA